uniref:Major facilitator superfamily (MFS) profile domain-containing protein n=1 Tax=Branchiostoma floridae TaxID=7739 RepID=C3YSM9_BRAFL|eukprot:XP_002600718.1 hypothetical protein BRAFLDRAFT_83460 [Branchiostoma floridae]
MRARRVHERPPDGGWGWMILLSNFVMCACVFGVQKSFGVFFVEFREYFGESSGGTAWINSIMSAVAHGGGALAVPLSVRFGTRPVVMVGGVLSCLGLVLSTFANSILYLYFSLGVLTGLSYAMVFAPSVAMLGRYFDKRRALVNGIALSGSGATFALAPVCQLLEQTYGWRGALLLLGGVTLNLCVSGALLRPIVLAADVRRFLLFASADLLSSFSYLIPYVHVVPCARYRGIDETKAPFLLSVAGITEVLARVFSGWFSDLKIISKLHVYMMFIALNALACFLFPLATSYPALLAYSVAMGTCTGGFRALIMPLVADTVGVVRMPNAFGLTLVCEGVGILLGPPVAGWLYDATENYNSSFFVAGGCFVASLVPLCGLSYINRTLQRDSVIATPIEQENEPSDVLCGSTPLVERETSF